LISYNALVFEVLPSKSSFLENKKRFGIHYFLNPITLLIVKIKDVI
jgi:hypothetical protein